MGNSLRKNVLIAGGTGLIGSALSTFLIANGFQVKILSRRQASEKKNFFAWEPATGNIDENALPWADYIINLAGEGIANKPWNSMRKTEVIKSRTDAAQLLINQINQNGKHIKAYLAASAIGYYGNIANGEVSETSVPGNDFLAQTCQTWEKANLKEIRTGTRRVIFRIGLVLSSKGGALKEMLKPFKIRIGIVFGNGSQVYSWIHIEDVCRMILFLLDNPAANGIYNAVAPNPVTNLKLVQEIALQKGGGYLIVRLKPIFFNLMLGERSALLLNGQYVSAQKILTDGFEFEFPELQGTLQSLLK